MSDFIAELQRRIALDPEISVASISKAAGLDPSTVRLAIKHGRSIRMDTAGKIAAVFGQTVSEFITKGQDPVTSEILRLLEKLTPAERRLLLNAARGLRADGRPEDQ